MSYANPSCNFHNDRTQVAGLKGFLAPGSGIMRNSKSCPKCQGTHIVPNTRRRRGKRYPRRTALIKRRNLYAVSLHVLRLYGIVDRRCRRYCQVQEEIRFLTELIGRSA